MILLMAGSSEAHVVLPVLLEGKSGILITTATDYPYNLCSWDAEKRIEIRRGRLNRELMEDLLRNRGIRCLLDATHPFAVEASLTAMDACRETGIPYVRFQRKEFLLPESEFIHRVPDVEKAAQLACQIGKIIFLTTGSKELEPFSRLVGEMDRKLIARVLPTPESVGRCLSAGVHPDNIIALKGPFSSHLNYALWHELGVDTVVTKQSGEEGGLKEKVEVALNLKIHLIVIDRPALTYTVYFEDVDKLRGYLKAKKII